MSLELGDVRTDDPPGLSERLRQLRLRYEQSSRPPIRCQANVGK
ncbi:MAG: hypothetical protein ACREXY_11630 [Gammaproteobacteria bacterium]